jgi:hypothetical protein
LDQQRVWLLTEAAVLHYPLRSRSFGSRTFFSRKDFMGNASTGSSCVDALLSAIEIDLKQVSVPRFAATVFVHEYGVSGLDERTPMDLAGTLVRAAGA